MADASAKALDRLFQVLASKPRLEISPLAANQKSAVMEFAAHLRLANAFLECNGLVMKRPSTGLMLTCLLGLAVEICLSASALAQAPKAVFAQKTDSLNGAHTQVLPDRSRASVVEFIKVHGRLLEGNLEGDSPDRDVAVLLPPSYGDAKNRRYPVLYMLHGFTDMMGRWFGLEKFWINLPDVVDRAYARGAAEMIVVMPDAYTRYEGSMYSTSVTTGDWEGYIASELVAYIDSHYRTLSRAESRGIAGHSLGGYGALRIGMRHPEAFSAVYAMNPCCLTPGFAVPQDAAAAVRIEAVKTFDDLAKADIVTRAAFASAAAWSPNPKSPPFFVDLPWRNGAQQPIVVAKWTANRPLFMVDQNIWHLRELRGIGFDGGRSDIPDNVTGVQILHDELDAYAIPHQFELYDGDHTSGVEARIEKVVMPFFGQMLDQNAARKTSNRDASRR